jgi:hypothetical protein
VSWSSRALLTPSSHEIRPVLTTGSQEKSHHESKVGSDRPWRIGANGQWGKCTTPDKRSTARSASVAHIQASLWICLARNAAISIIGRRLRIIFARKSIIPESRPRAIPDTSTSRCRRSPPGMKSSHRGSRAKIWWAQPRPAATRSAASLRRVQRPASMPKSNYGKCSRLMSLLAVLS